MGGSSVHLDVGNVDTADDDADRSPIRSAHSRGSNILRLLASPLYPGNHNSTVVRDELAPGVPDLRIPLELALAIRDHETTAYVDIEPPEMDIAMLTERICEIDKGLGERGRCLLVEEGRVRMFFAMTDDGPEQQRFVEEYAEQMLRYFGMPKWALLRCRIVRKESSSAARAERDSLRKSLGRGGLRAL